MLFITGVNRLSIESVKTYYRFNLLLSSPLYFEILVWDKNSIETWRLNKFSIDFIRLNFFSTRSFETQGGKAATNATQIQA
jgi:hypothetical protein